MHAEAINWLAVLASVVAMQVIGAIWYAPPVFGKVWMKAVERTPEQLGSPARAMPNAVFLAILTSIAMAILVGLAGASGIAEALILGLVVGVGFCGAVIGTNAGFEGRSVTLVAINAGHYLLDILAISLILTLWK